MATRDELMAGALTAYPQGPRDAWRPVFYPAFLGETARNASFRAGPEPQYHPFGTISYTANRASAAATQAVVKAWSTRG
jgi:hypothetical protein